MNGIAEPSNIRSEHNINNRLDKKLKIDHQLFRIKNAESYIT